MNQVLDDRYIMLNVDDILARIRKTRSTLYRWIEEDRFPRPSGPKGSPWWSLAEVKQWFDRQADAKASKTALALKQRSR